MPQVCFQFYFFKNNFWCSYCLALAEEWIWLLQDEVLLSDWKQQLDRDADTLKMKGNLNSLRTVSACNLSFTCLLIILLLIILAVSGNIIF